MSSNNGTTPRGETQYSDFVPDQVRKSGILRRFTGIDLAFLLTFAEWANLREDRTFYVCQESLAHDFGVTSRTVRNAIARFVNAGVLREAGKRFVRFRDGKGIGQPRKAYALAEADVLEEIASSFQLPTRAMSDGDKARLNAKERITVSTLFARKIGNGDPLFSQKGGNGDPLFSQKGGNGDPTEVEVALKKDLDLKEKGHSGIFQAEENGDNVNGATATATPAPEPEELPSAKPRLHALIERYKLDPTAAFELARDVEAQVAEFQGDQARCREIAHAYLNQWEAQRNRETAAIELTAMLPAQPATVNATGFIERANVRTALAAD